MASALIGVSLLNTPISLNDATAPSIAAVSFVLTNSANVRVKSSSISFDPNFIFNGSLAFS